MSTGGGGPPALHVVLHLGADVPGLRVLLRGRGPRLSLGVCLEGVAPGLEQTPHCVASNLKTHAGILRLRAKVVERAVVVKSGSVEWAFEIR